MPREIFYTFNASAPPADPTVNSTKYTAPLTYPTGGGYYKAIAREEGVVTAVTSKSFDRSPTDYIAYYPFSGNALDASGNGYNLINNGAVLTTDKNGDADSAYEFGLNKNMTSPVIYPKTLSFKIMFSTTPTPNHSVIVGGNGTNEYIFDYGKDVGGFRMYYAGYSNAVLYTLDIGVWKQFLLVENGSNTDLYCNGVKLGTFNQKLSNAYITKYGCSYAYSTTEYFTGKLDEIKIFNRALTEVEAIQLTTE